MFFLVDPSVNILSTLRVPPQQQSWFKEEIAKKETRLPVEIMEKIVDFLDWPMSLEEAKEHRNKLMDERKYFVDESNREHFERIFYLCEH